MENLFSSDPMAIFAEWERMLSQRVPMADGTEETTEFGVWLNCAKSAIGTGCIADIRDILEEFHFSQDPVRKRAQRSLKPIVAAPSGPRMSALVQDAHCWAYQPGIAGMGLTVVEETGVKLCQWVLLAAAEKFPFIVKPGTRGNLIQGVEGLSDWASNSGRVVNELVDEMCRRSPVAPLLTLPEIPVRPRSKHDDRTPVERVLAQTLQSPDGRTFTVSEAVRQRLIIEASKGTRGARALLTRDRHRCAKRAGRTLKQAFPTAPPLIARTIRFICGQAGVGSDIEELGITANFYPIHPLYSWVLDAAWERGGRPDDPEAFKKFIRSWVLGELANVPKEYRPEPKVEAPPEAA